MGKGQIMQTETDANLVFRCLAGDTDAFGVLVGRYQSAVYATAYYYAGRYGAAEDITQESFWAAYRSLAHLKDAERFGPWLKEVTTRTAANWLRRNLSRLRQETPLPYRRTVSMEEARQGLAGAQSREERFEQVQRAIDALPERYRLPIMLRYLQELSYEEISRFTGESLDEVRGILQRGTAQLRSLLLEQNAAKEEVQWRRAPK